MKNSFTKEHTNIAKGVAILLLLMYHLFGEVETVCDMGVIYAPVPENIFFMLSRFGNICVSIFVFLTGYGITKGILSKEDISIKETYLQALKRFGKLMFHFLILYVSVIVVMFPYFDLAGYYGPGFQGVVKAVTDALGFWMFHESITLNESWWYMEVAYILIFLVPLLALVVRRIGYVLLPILYFLPFIITFNFDVERYLLVAGVGVCAAYGKWLEKGLEWKLPIIAKWLIAIVGTAVCIKIRQNTLIQESYLYVADAVISLFLVWAGSVTLAGIPGIRTVFAFIGRHSMNIYLVHTFFYLSVWRNEIYYFKYAPVTFILLLAVTLLYSVLLEAFKKGVSWLIAKIKKKYKPAAENRG